MRDLAFDIRANDRTQAAFDSAGRRANTFGMEMDQTARSISGAVNQTNRLTAATERYAAAGRRAMSANDNWQRRNLMMQMGDVGQTLALGASPMQVLLQQGPQIAQIYGPNEGGLTRVFKEMGSMVVGAATKFPLLSAAAVAAGVGLAGLTYEINQTTDTAVSFGNVATAVFQVAASAIYEQLRPAIEAIAPWFASAWDMVVGGTKTAVNLFIGAWVVQIDALHTAVGLVPDAFIAAGEAAANGFLSAMEEMAQETVAMFNGLIAKINGMLRAAGLEGQIGDLGDPNAIGFGRIDIGGAAARDRLSSGFGGFMDRAGDAMNRDYAGEMFDAVRQQAIANALSAGESDGSNSGKSTADKFKATRDGFAEMIGYTSDYIAAQKRANDELAQFSNIAQGAGSSLANALKDGKLEAGELLSVLSQVAVQLLTMSGFGNSPFGGFVTGFLGGFGGFRANGGPVDPWKSYVVGEKGPEIIRMGSRGGHVTANKDIEGGGRSVVEIRLASDVEARMLRQAGDQSVQIVQAAAPGIMQGSVSAVQATARNKPGFFR